PAPAQPVPPPPPEALPQPATPPQAGPVRSVTINEAVALALEQNVSLRVQRMTPEIVGLDLAQVYAAWLPALAGNLLYQSLKQPPSSFLQTGEDTPFTQDQLIGSFGVEQVLPTGGSYALGYEASRTENNNAFATLNPATRGNLTFSFTQPLLRNRGIDNTRLNLVVSRNNRSISDLDLRNTVVGTVRDVKNAYWDVVVARSNLAVQQQTLELARQTLGDNRKRVEVGTMAPIDIVQAEAEEASNEENVIIAEQTLAQAQDRLRALLLDPGTPDFFDTTFETTELPALAAAPVDVDAAVAAAIANRLDLQQARKQLENNEVRIRFFQNQVLPAIGANVDYGLAGLGGTINQRDNTVFPPGPPTSTRQRGYSDVVRDIFGFDFPTWTVSLQVNYPLGRNPNRINLERARLQNDQSLLQLRDLERQVVQQVRDLARQVNTNLKRVATTRAARSLAERRLEAEQKKFGVGLSTTFNVLQAQRDLAAARNNEQRAILDFEKSRVDFEASQEASISGGGGISLVGTSQQGNTSTAGAGGTQVGTQQNGQQQGGTQQQQQRQQ
ncbi:MAG: TolC family protein, partial [Acidobacteria bacterium]|nr:TolC family protein [Acidobacteriota bacterium]